jgi:hypothetical protein
MTMSFRAFVTSVLRLDMSPLIAAIVDSSESTPITTIHDGTCITHFGCGACALPRTPPRTVAIRAGGRGGKTSRLLAPKALHAAWTVPLPTLRRGEVAVALLVGPDLKLGRQALSFVDGYIDDSPILSKAVVDRNKESIELKRPDGKHVRIEVLAASRGGRGVRGRTLVYAGLDEACFFYDEATGVVNDADLYRAVLQRVVPGGQCWIASTPWLAEVGLLESFIAKDFGVHDHALCVTAGTRALNPTWDPTGEIETDLRAQDPDAAAREIDGQPMAGGAGLFFDVESLKACTVDLALPAPPNTVAASAWAADLGFTRDASALVGVALDAGALEVISIDELRPSKNKPLIPSAVYEAFAGRMREYGATRLAIDSFSREPAREAFGKAGIRLDASPSGREGNAEMYLHLKRLIGERKIRLPNHPRLIAQLRSVVSKPTPGNPIPQIILPRRSGNHCDVASALVAATWQVHSPGGPRQLKPGTLVGFCTTRGTTDERRFDGTFADSERIEFRVGEPPKRYPL